MIVLNVNPRDFSSCEELIWFRLCGLTQQDTSDWPEVTGTAGFKKFGKVLWEFHLDLAGVQELLALTGTRSHLCMCLAYWPDGIPSAKGLKKPY